MPVSGAQFEETLASASPDLLRAMIREFAQRMMDADVEVRVQRGVRAGSPDRVISATGTGAGNRIPGRDSELAIPKLRQGRLPGVPGHRRRAQRALASVVAPTPVPGGGLTRRVEKLAASLGVTGGPCSAGQARWPPELGDLVDPPGPELLVTPWPEMFMPASDALTQKVREGSAGPRTWVARSGSPGVNADRVPGDPRHRPDLLRGRCRSGWRSCAAWAAVALVRRRPGDQRRPRRAGERHRRGAARGGVAALSWTHAPFATCSTRVPEDPPSRGDRRCSARSSRSSTRTRSSPNM